MGGQLFWNEQALNALQEESDLSKKASTSDDMTPLWRLRQAMGHADRRPVPSVGTIPER